MALVTVSYLLAEMKENNLNCWNIKDNKNLLAEVDDDTIDTAASAAILQNKLSLLAGSGIVTVTLSKSVKKNRVGKEAFKVRTYTINTGEKELNKMDISGINSELKSLREENAKLKEQLISQTYEQKLKDLEKKIEGLENKPDDDDPIGRVVDLVIPILSNMLVNPAPAPAPNINGIEEDTVLDEWLKLDPEAIKVMKAIVNLAKNKPSQYQTYKPILLNL